MVLIDTTLTTNLIATAYRFETFRTNCKNFLNKHDLSFDKFTVVSHDSFVGYITEYLLRDYIATTYASHGLVIDTWENKFDIKRILNIIHIASNDAQDIQYVRSYFYDQYDLKISKGDVNITIDIKSALTKLEPKSSWNFMYPAVQAQKCGKDYIILVYYIVENLQNIESLKKLAVIGYMSQDIIKKCPVVKSGTLTRFGTKSQIDNYETELAFHYKNIDELISVFL